MKKIYVNKNTYLKKDELGQWKIYHKSGHCDAKWNEANEAYDDCAGIVKLDRLRAQGKIKKY